MGLTKILCHQSTYRGYIIGVERKGSIWLTTASPKTPDLPILDCYGSDRDNLDAKWTIRRQYKT